MSATPNIHCGVKIRDKNTQLLIGNSKATPVIQAIIINEEEWNLNTYETQIHLYTFFLWNPHHFRHTSRHLLSSVVYPS